MTCRTIAPLLKTWADERDPHHAGVVFVDEMTHLPADIAG